MDRYLFDPNDPNLAITTGSTFGGPNDTEDNGRFAFGGVSTEPDGSINPEPYAAFPRSLYESGKVKPGGQYEVTNPANGQTAMVIARDIGPSAKNRGIDLAPHVAKAIGAETDQPLVVNFNPGPSLAEAMSVPLDSSPLAGASVNALPTTPPIMSGPLQHAQMLTDESAPQTGDDDHVDFSAHDTGDDTATADAIRDSSDTTPAASSDEMLAPKAHPGLRVVGQAPDGSWVKYSNGMVVNKLDRSITYMSPDGTKWIQRDGEKPIKLTPPPKDRVSFQTLTGPDGLPYSAEVNLDKHTVTPIGDPTTRALTQQQNLKLRIINSAKQQPGLQAYINVKNNYDSLRQNAAIPDKDRTPVDDAMAMQAAGAIEHPGTGITDADKAQMAKLVPFWTRMRMMYDNIRHNKSRTLTSQSVQEMADAAKRALDGRANTYREQIEPIKKQAIAAHLDPDEVVGSLFENATPLDQNTPNPQTGTIPVPPNIKVGEPVYGNASGTGPKRYYTGANPLDKNDQSNYSTTPLQ